MNSVPADIIGIDSGESSDLAAVEVVPEVVSAELAEATSWPFRVWGFFKWLISTSFGIGSAIFFLALAASIPVVQFISLGYLLEVTGRVGRSGRLRDGFVDLDKASIMGRAVLGTWLCLLPIRLVSQVWYNAWLIDPGSGATMLLRFVQFALVALIVPHILAAWFCGGRLSHFFWPLVAPFSLTIWLARKLVGISGLRRTLESLTGWLAPGLSDDMARVQPLQHWFLPAVVWRNVARGSLIRNARDNLWNFLGSLQLPYYFTLGLKGFVGSFLWLFGPTMLLIGSTMLISDNQLSADEMAGISALLALLAMMVCAVIFAVLPAIQAHFATERRFACFFEIGAAWRAVRGAPVTYCLAVCMMFLLTVPLFFFDVEPIPNELMWTLVIFFMVLIWPGKILLGWAYGKGMNRERPRPWWLATPIAMLTLPIAFAYCFLLFFTRYTSWNGAWSLLENEVFLLPAPFWINWMT